MKKTINILLAIVFAISLAFNMGCNGCKAKTPDKITVIAPDGAPAISIAQMMANNENFGEEVTYTIVNSTNLSTYITEGVDVAVVPVNMATMVAAKGYKIVAINTQGNLYMLGANVISNLTDLIGKKVGCIQYGNVPGLTLRAILNEANVPYQQIGDVNSDIDENKVNIFGCEPTAVAGLLSANKADYVLTAEPSAIVVINKLTSAGKDVKVCLNIQQIYETTFGEKYPQAVTIVSDKLIEKNPAFIKKFVKGLQNNASYLTEDNITSIIEAINTHMEEGVTSSLSSANLNIVSLINSNVEYADAQANKDRIINYINKIITIDATKAKAISEDIFYSVK